MIRQIKKIFRYFYHHSKAFNHIYTYMSRIKVDRLRSLSDEEFLCRKFKENTGEELDLENPVTFNMKSQWLKLYDRNPLYTKLVDKYAVRKYVEKKLGGGVLNDLYGVYHNTSEIKLDELPGSFVLKCTHDSGGVVICKDKASFNKKEAYNKLESSLKRNYFWVGREWPYKNVRPRIIAEKYMEDSSGEGLRDYKVFCFSGTPKVIQVDYDRFTNHQRNLYDPEWNYLPYTTLYQTDSDHVIEKPVCLEEMLDYSTQLSKGIPFVRVDWYVVDDKPIFGEMTFFHGGGMEPFYPKEWDYTLGSWLKLPPKDKWV